MLYRTLTMYVCMYVCPSSLGQLRTGWSPCCVPVDDDHGIAELRLGVAAAGGTESGRGGHLEALQDPFTYIPGVTFVSGTGRSCSTQYVCIYIYIYRHLHYPGSIT